MKIYEEKHLFQRSLRFADSQKVMGHQELRRKSGGSQAAQNSAERAFEKSIRKGPVAGVGGKKDVQMALKYLVSNPI